MDSVPSYRDDVFADGAGVVPMAIGLAGGEANAPRARTLIGGVLAATILSLIVVPCLYTIIKRDPMNATATEVSGI